MSAPATKGNLYDYELYLLYLYSISVFHLHFFFEKGDTHTHHHFGGAFFKKMQPTRLFFFLQGMCLHLSQVVL